MEKNGKEWKKWNTMEKNVKQLFSHLWNVLNDENQCKPCYFIETTQMYKESSNSTQMAAQKVQSCQKRWQHQNKCLILFMEHLNVIMIEGKKNSLTKFQHLVA